MAMLTPASAALWSSSGKPSRDPEDFSDLLPRSSAQRSYAERRETKRAADMDSPSGAGAMPSLL